MRGGVVIGKGSYGVVHYNDPIPCNTEDANDPEFNKLFVSKLMSAGSAWNEYDQTQNIHKKVNKLGLETYFVFPRGKPCDVDVKLLENTENVYDIIIQPISTSASDEIYKIIDGARKNPEKYRILHIPYGGDSTSKYVNELFLSNNMDSMNELKTQIIDAFEYGLLPLNRNRIYHKDLKLENMVILDNQVKIIDWGLSLDMDANDKKPSYFKNEIIPGYVQYNAPLSAPMVVSNDKYYDNIAFDNVNNHCEKAHGPTDHLNTIIDITKLAVGVVNDPKNVNIINDYETFLQTRYKTCNGTNKTKFIEEYHRGVDMWGLVIIFGELLRIYQDKLHENTKQQISRAVIELYRLESIEMKDEQITKMLHMLRAIDFTGMEKGVDQPEFHHVFDKVRDTHITPDNPNVYSNVYFDPKQTPETNRRLFSQTTNSVQPLFKRVRRKGGTKRRKTNKANKARNRKSKKNRNARKNHGKSTQRSRR